MEQCEEHFLLEECFRWRCHADALVGPGGKQRLGGGHVLEVEEFKKTIDRIAIAKVGKTLPVGAEAIGVDLLGEPFHLRLVGGGFVGDNQTHVSRIAEDAGETF